MRIALGLIIILNFVFALGEPVVAQQRLPKDLVGSYLFRFEWGGTRIKLNSNGTFSKESSSCTSVTTESGLYSFSEDIVHFTVLKITMRSFSDMKEIDLRKRKARKEFLDTDEPFKPEQHELRVIRWGERTYLMDTSEFGRFIDAINLGFEPRKVDGYRALYGHILMREGDEDKEVVGPPSLPAEFLKLLLSAPITAKVLQLEITGNKSIATVDRGSRDGLREGMTLVPESSTAALHFQGYWVLSVDEQSAKVQVFDGVQVGDKLTTRVADVSRYTRLNASEQAISFSE